MKKLLILRKGDYDFLSKIKRLTLISVLIFLATSFAGFLSSSLFPELPEKILGGVDELVEKILMLSDFEFFLFIFINNGFKILASIILGVFFGIIPLIFLLVNGFLVGIVAYTSLYSFGIETFWLGILPHGIFEIPALILGTASGFYLGDLLYRKTFLKEKLELKIPIQETLKFSLRVIVPLIFFAAFIEVFITSLII